MLAIPHKRQLADGYCLPACVEMVMAYWGDNQSQRRLARQLQTIEGVGTAGYRLHRLASRRWDVAYGEGELPDLAEALENGIPPIVLVQTADLQYWGDLNFAHALVVAAMTKETVWVHDPDQDQAPITVSLGNFALAWLGMRWATCMARSAGNNRHALSIN